ncbi:MAG: nucleotide sugar dehydrogenase [Candidatus Auribacterota bacterium]|nr:nucleotide sugar dehydrogenase [Candidatus Auribacterota bacterium]
MKNKIAEKLLNKIEARTAVVGVIGLGYVGLPLAIEFARAGFPVTGFDLDEKKVRAVNAGRSYIKHISSAAVREISGREGCLATADFKLLRKTDCILICVPTPLTSHQEPDMTYIEATVAVIVRYIRPGQLIILESTTYPGTTREIVRPPLEAKGLKAGQDFFLAFSPEREDPGNPKYSTSSIPKVVGGLNRVSLTLSRALYGAIVPDTIPVSSPDAAEATKLLENIYRSVNIALVNELKVVFEKMGVDIWEVINAASSKPFGYTPFYPGPGLGGHCIPIDPFYLTWRAREFDTPTRFIQLAGEINTAMPERVIDRLARALNEEEKSLKGSLILILGVAYKKDVDDMRESPALRLIELLQGRGAKVEYHDPYVPVLPRTRKYRYHLKSVSLTPSRIGKSDAVLIATEHTMVNYKLVGQNASLIIDTRNAMADLRRVKARVVRA